MKKRFKITYTPRGERDLTRFRKRYWKAYNDYLIQLAALECDPYGIGEPLKGNLKGYYALHFSRKPECRAIYEIKNDLVIVVIVRIGTRENFYDIF